MTAWEKEERANGEMGEEKQKNRGKDGKKFKRNGELVSVLNIQQLHFVLHRLPKKQASNTPSTFRSEKEAPRLAHE